MSALPAAEGIAPLLPVLLRWPGAFASLSLQQWDLVIRQALRAGILARLCFQLDEMRLLEDVPERPRHHLEAARTVAQKHMRDVRWEIACVRRVLEKHDISITLLKGAAYAMADLPPFRLRGG